eukprot:IDg19869t1
MTARREAPARACARAAAPCVRESAKVKSERTVAVRAARGARTREIVARLRRHGTRVLACARAESRREGLAARLMALPAVLPPWKIRRRDTALHRTAVFAVRARSSPPLASAPRTNRCRSISALSNSYSRRRAALTAFHFSFTHHNHTIAR